MVKSHLALREVAFLNELQTMGVEVFIRTQISQMNANGRESTQMLFRRANTRFARHGVDMNIPPAPLQKGGEERSEGGCSSALGNRVPHITINH